MKAIAGAAVVTCCLGIDNPVRSEISCRHYSLDNSTLCDTSQVRYESRYYNRHNIVTISGPAGSLTECRYWSHDNTTTCD